MLLTARVLSVEEFFRLGTFTAASVQRDYIWDSQQSEDLLADVERAATAHSAEPEQEGGVRISVAAGAVEDDEGADEAAAPQTGQDDAPSYHLGSVVLRRDGDESFEIFDGLQRATTLTILLCIIRDLTASEALRERIAAVIFQGAVTRLVFPGSDGTLFAEIQAAAQAIRSFRRPVSARGLRIRRSRSVFHGYLKMWDQDRLARFGDFLLSRTLLVVATTECQTLARQVFITANNRGLQLRPVDIFKGQLLELAENGEALEKAALRWNGIMHVAGEGIEDFMRAYDFVKRCEPQGPDHLAKLAGIIEKNYGANGLDEVLDDILRHASTWAWLMERLKTAPGTPADLDIWRLRFFKWFEWKPIALAWYHDYGEKRGVKTGGAAAKAENAFKQRFGALHRICMMMTLAKFSANDRARIFGKALSQSRNPFSTSTIRPGALTFRPQQIARILESLATPLQDDETRLSLMRWLESMSDEPAFAADAAFASVEHVLPQRPAPDSQWLKDFPDEDERFFACHSIGNLALMDYSENLKITNLDFHLKLPTIKEQSQKYKTLAGIAEKTSWKAAEIRERAGKMIDLACKQLNIPRPGRP
ncbi:MAG: DUF262 domain-containing HNH endonuclease family protein [Rhodomicrobium sp.]